MKSIKYMLRLSFLPVLLLTASAMAQAQTLPLKLKQTTLTFNEQSLQIQIPDGYEQTFITGPGFETYSYSSEINRFILEISLQSPDKTVLEEIKKGQLKEIVLSPYSNEKDMLYGEYRINSETQDHLDYTSYLKKQPDDYLPAMYFRLHEYYSLKKDRIFKISCKIQGLDSEKTLTDKLFETIDKDCTQIIKSARF